MNIEDLRYIQAICRYESMSKAAESLQITVQGLSQAVRRIEKECGLKLFVRSSSGTKPTEATLSLLPDLEQVLRDYDSLTEKVKELAAREKSTLCIGVDSAPFSLKLLNFSYEYADAHNLNLIEADLRTRPYVPGEQRDPAPDLFFIRGNPDELEFPGYRKVLFSQRAFLLIGSRDACSRFARDSWSSLDGKIIYFSFLEEDHPDFQYISRHCREAGARPKFRELPETSIEKQLLARPDTLACLFQSRAEPILQAHDSLAACETQEPILGQIWLAASREKNRLLNPLISALKEELGDEYE